MGVLKKILMTVVAMLTGFCIVFALGFIDLEAPVHQEAVPDAKGNIFTGDYLPSKGSYVGKVTIVFPDGAVYSGGFSNSRFNGYGHYRSAAGWEIEGTFEDGKLVKPAGGDADSK